MSIAKDVAATRAADRNEHKFLSGSSKHLSMLLSC